MEKEGANTDVVIHGTDTLDNFEAAVHMGKAVFVDSLWAEFISILEAIDWEIVLAFSSNIVNTVSHLLEVAIMIVSTAWEQTTGAAILRAKNVSRTAYLLNSWTVFEAASATC